MEEVRGTDPELAALRQMITAWVRVLGCNRSITVQEIITEALKEDCATKLNPDLLEAIRVVSDGKDWGKALGWWLRNKRDRIISTPDGRFRFLRNDSKDQLRWILDNVDKPQIEMGGL